MTTTSTRRAMLRGTAIATAAAAAGLVPIGAQAITTAADPDARFLVMLTRARATLDKYLAAEELAHERRKAADADPTSFTGPQAYIDADPERRSNLKVKTLARAYRDHQQRLWDRYGYSAASDLWNAAGAGARAAVARVIKARPETAAAVLAKWQFAETVYVNTDIWEREEAEDVLFPALIADLKRLAGSAVAT